MMRWDALLRHYDVHHRPRVEAEQAWFARSRNLDEAIRRAALATDDRGKRFHHQRRIPPTALRAACQALIAETTSIARATNFETLHAIVAAARVRGTGPLYAYDTALRIGYYRNLLPIKVYVHAGTRTGARRLGLSQRAIEPRDLPAALRRRPAHEVEDILCIYKDDLGPNPDPSSTSSNGCAPRAPKRNAALSD